ncbi:MAG TPA: DUF3016 domain-containing protein [Opitutaceae bacterium]|nr:DUF3016 domain-containing protein [Opitutaceae bacterium]
MKTLRLLLALGALAAGSALRAANPPAPPVDVTYVNPDKFTDVKDSYFVNDKVRDEYLDELKQHFQAQAKDYVPAGWHLALRVTDVDMAGDFEPWRGPQYDDIRIVKDVYPPRMKFEFTLTNAAGKVVKEGQRSITNLSFLNEINIYFPDDQLRYEKALIDDWYRQEFGSAKKLAEADNSPGT